VTISIRFSYLCYFRRWSWCFK